MNWIQDSLYERSAKQVQKKKIAKDMKEKHGVSRSKKRITKKVQGMEEKNEKG